MDTLSWIIIALILEFIIAISFCNSKQREDVVYGFISGALLGCMFFQWSVISPCLLGAFGAFIGSKRISDE